MAGNNLEITPAVTPFEQAKNALIDTINQLKNEADQLPLEVTINVGVIGYSGIYDNYYKSGGEMSDLKSGPETNNIIYRINEYEINEYGDGTNTLGALEEANRLLDESSLTGENIIILLSDGNPLVKGYYSKEYCDSRCWQNPVNKCFSSKSCACVPCTGGPYPPYPIGYYKQNDFTIAAYGDSCEIGCWSPQPPYPGTMSAYSKSYILDQGPDIHGFSNSIKTNKKIYTIFYYTGYQSEWVYNSYLVTTNSCPQKMCEWSSENAENCDETSCDLSEPDSYSCGGTYAFAGENVEKMFNKVIEGIFSSPENTTINNIAVPFPVDPSLPYVLNKELNDWELNFYKLLSCTNQTPLSVIFDNSGKIKISDVQFEYCEPLLHY